MSLPNVNTESNFWNKSSSAHAFPRVSFPEFQHHMEFVKFPVINLSKLQDLLVKSYGLSHVYVINELKHMSKSEFDGSACFFNEYDIHERWWYPGMYLKYYWKSW